MKTTLKIAHTLGNKFYPQGDQELPDHLYGNQAFKKAVQAGSIVVHPRDAHAQKAQASKDARALQKAVGAKKLADEAIAARAALSSNKDILGADKSEMPEAEQPEQLVQDAQAEQPMQPEQPVQASQDDEEK